MTDIRTLIDSYGDYLFRFALFRIGDRTTAEDIVQETFIAAWKSRDSFKAKSSEKTWLVSILKHKLFDFYRSSSRGIAARIDSSVMVDDEFDDRGVWKDKPGRWDELPDEKLDRKLFRDVLRACIQRLSIQQRQAFVLRVIDGHETNKICNESGVSATNLLVLLHRARMGLRKCLNERWFSVENTGKRL